MSAQETIAWALRRSTQPALRLLVPEDELGDGRHRPARSSPSARSSTSTPTCSSRRRTRRATRLAEPATGSSSTATRQPTPRRAGRPLRRRALGPRARRLLRDSQGRADARGALCRRLLGRRRSAARTRPARASAAKFGWDKRFELWKLNPLADWTERDVWNYIHEHDLPYNPLHDRRLPLDRLHALHHAGRAPAARPATAAGRARTRPSAASTSGATRLRPASRRFPSLPDRFGEDFQPHERDR